MGYRKNIRNGRSAPKFTNKYQVRDMHSDALVPLKKATVDHNFLVTDRINFDPINPKEQPARVLPQRHLPFTRPDRAVLRPDVLPDANYTPKTWSEITPDLWSTWDTPWGDKNF